MAEKPASELYGQELYPGLFFKAAVYMHGFATRQFFHDGNKRTAYVCAAVFLELNGFVVDVNDMELYETALLVANGGMTENALANWLETHSRME
ncbi:MAG: hypothetical protein A2201_10595 [Alicyclobacillus sp. RIFOXYA1_FULL_53_8]|nr:MAG: hypothetical protein A2201_10595 [Alicyclobacillus sp. RIFOXYA1_FULL_53_8]